MKQTGRFFLKIPFPFLVTILQLTVCAQADLKVSPPVLGYWYVCKKTGAGFEGACFVKFASCSPPQDLIAINESKFSTKKDACEASEDVDQYGPQCSGGTDGCHP
jgi:hypothetical protein